MRLPQHWGLLDLVGWLIKGLALAVWYGGQLVVKGLAALAIVVGIGTAKVSRVVWRHGRPHAVKAGAWAARKSSAAVSAAATRTADRFAEKRPKLAAVARQVAKRTAPPQPPPAEQEPASATQNASPAVPQQRPKPTATKASGASRVPVSTSNTNGGVRMQEFRRITQATKPVRELEPDTAWELDEQLANFANIWPTIAEDFAAYAERLDRVVKVDPRVVQSYMIAVSQMAELYRAFGQTRLLYRQIYAAAFEAAESATRMPDKQGFWNKNAA